jgi:hypothetical protein
MENAFGQVWICPVLQWYARGAQQSSACVPAHRARDFILLKE